MPAPKFTPKLSAEICERLSKGEPLEWICRDDHMPASRTVSDWRAADPQFNGAFLAARDAGFDAIAAQCLHIADTPCGGVTEKFEKVLINNPDDPEGPKVHEFQLTERTVEDMLGHRRLQIETRLKLLSKWDPRRYGDKVQMEHSGEIRSMTDEELDARLRALLAASAEAEGGP